METIRNYLEAMFANMPRTAAVERAKQELLQMMEDKYNELIEEGKTENEAVGTVISEFGNLEELADALGLEEEVKQGNELAIANPRRMVSMDEAREFLQFNAMRAAGIALGVALCILCVTPCILLSGIAENAGAVLMFVLIFGGVALLIISGTLGGKWSYLKKEACAIDYATANYINDAKDNYRGPYVAQLTIGIILCASCWLPAVALSDLMTKSNVVSNISAVLLFLLIAIGVFLIIHTNMVMGGYDRLLKLNDADTISGGYNENYRSASAAAYVSDTAERIMLVYWPTVRRIYLIISIITMAWYITWIIWPIAGIVHALLKTIWIKNGEVA